MVVLFELGLPVAGMIAATVIGSSFTVLAHWRKWQLPVHSDWSLSLTPSQLKALLATRPGVPGPGKNKPDGLKGLAKELKEAELAEQEEEQGSGTD